MTGPKHAHPVRPSPQRPARPSEPTRSGRRGAVWWLLGLVLAVVVVASCVEVPRIAWLAVLVAALVLLDVALGLGLRQWLRDRAR